MEWNKVREKHKQLLLKWDEIREKIDPLEKICLNPKELGIEIKKPIPFEILKQWSSLKREEEKIFDEIEVLYKEYYQSRNNV